MEEVHEEDFISDQRLEEVLKLPAYNQRFNDDSKLHQDRAKPKTMGLNTLSTYVRHWDIDDALREFASNTIDEMAKARTGHDGTASLDGIGVTTGVQRKGREERSLVIFHDTVHRLAEIVYIPRHSRPKKLHEGDFRKQDDAVEYGTLEFINYGVPLPQGKKILFYGSTNKTGIKNQVGRYGEGLKCALACLLRNMFDVDIYATVPVKGTPTFQHWQFLLSDEKEVLCKFSKNALVPTITGGDVDYFKVVITFPSVDEDLIKFDLFDYIVPKEHLNDSAGGGIVLFEPELRGRIYSHHFFVVSWNSKYMRYAYDLPGLRIGRDRKTVNQEEFQRAVARCWSERICSSNDLSEGNEYYHLVSEEPDSSSLVEVSCMPFLTHEARSVLTNLFVIHNGVAEDSIQPITRNIDRKQYPTPTAVCPEHLYRAITAGGDDNFLFTNHEALVSNFMEKTFPCGANLEHMLIDVFQDRIRVVFSESDLLFFVKTDTPENRMLFTVSRGFLDTFAMDLVSLIAFKWLPRYIDDDDSLDLYQCHMKIMNAPAQAQAPNNNNKRPREEESSGDIEVIHIEPETKHTKTDDNDASAAEWKQEFVLPHLPKGYRWHAVAKRENF